MPVCVLRVFIITLVFCLVSAVVFAQEDQTAEITEAEEVTTADPRAAEYGIIFPESSTGTPAVNSGSSALNILRILLTLAVVAAAIYGLVYLIKKFTRGKTSKDPYLKILATTPLGASRSACVLSVGTQAWLVGVSEHGVNLISEINDKDILDTMLLEEAKKSAENLVNKTGFKSFIQRLGIQTDSEIPGPENIRKRREKFKGL